MKIALLTWSDGENDPFTSFNETLRDEFAKCGRESILVKIDSQLTQNIRKLKETGLDFAITWQGLGSNLKNADANQCIWDELKVPLFCIHGDHPSQMLDNHQALSSHVRHLYSVSSFNHYANRHIKRTHPALMFKTPILNQQKTLAARDGNYFVFVKNLDDTFITLQSWQNRLPPLLLNSLTNCALAITESLQKNALTDHHSVIDQVLLDENFTNKVVSNLRISDEKSIYHWMHQELNKFYRNLQAEQVLTELKQFPLMIFGRGWERHAANGNPNHKFHPPREVKESENLFYSRWGIVDIAPSFDSLHDRTLRAMACKGSFLIGSNWPHAELMGDSERNLFFDSRPGQLLHHAEALVIKPEAHHEQCLIFAENYQRWASHFELLRTMELLRCQFS